MARQGRAARAVRRITRPYSAYGPLLEYGLPVKSGVVCYGVIGAHLCASVRVALQQSVLARVRLARRAACERQTPQDALQ